MSRGVPRGGYDEDDLPIVPRGSKIATAPRKVARQELNTGGTLPIPRVAGAPQSTIPHAVPAPIPQTYAVQRTSGPTEAYGGANIEGLPSIGSPGTVFQLGLGAIGLWLAANYLAKK